MELILFIDTETTGFVDERMPLNHENQPWLVSLSAELCHDTGRVQQSFSVLVYNPGVPIPAKATEVHGITTDKAMKYGVKAATALGLLRHLALRADLVVAHNIRFDIMVIEVALVRAKDRMPPWDMSEITRFCTMEASAPIVNLPPTERMKAAGLSKPKAPKLEEAYRFFFDEDLADAHTSMADVAACRRIYFELERRKAANA